MRSCFWGSAGRTTFKTFASSAFFSSSFLIPLCAPSMRAHSYASSRRKMDSFCHAWASDVKYVSVAPGLRKSLGFLAALRDRVSVWNVDGPSSSLRMGLLRAPLPGHTKQIDSRLYQIALWIYLGVFISHKHTHTRTHNFVEDRYVLIFSTSAES